MNTFRRIVLFALATLLGACATADRAPLSMLADGQVYFRAVSHRSPVIVTRIDGQSNVFRTPLIDPGLHKVVFSAQDPALRTNDVSREYELRIAPCTRYYVAAQRSSALERDWRLVIEKSEPIGGCNAAAEVARAGQPADVASWSRDASPIVGDGRRYPS